MHANEVETDAALVRRLLAAQLPRWADLPIERVEHSGTDNAIYRLGDAMAVRMPRREEARQQVHKEHDWLPRLAPRLPIAIPLPLAKGEPAEGYPWHWSVCRWLEGEAASDGPIADLERAATDLARFVAALQRVDAAGAPAPGRHNFFRGLPLALRHARTLAAIEALHGVVDTDAVTAAWQAALRAPPWDGPPVWIHGDLKPANLLASGGRLSGVIDFGCLGAGDPACDAMVAWTFFDPASREVFRAALQVDAASWARARGWALSTSLIALPYYQHTNPGIVAEAKRTIREVLADAT
jgi:aminoglycoside phosphotransferase (APT) family kinase protein